MVEQGFKNKEIALELGIRPGTVKIHLKHIFEKTGVRGRYGLAISGLKERGIGFDGELVIWIRSFTVAVQICYCTVLLLNRSVLNRHA